MNLLYQSAFIEALGWSLVDSLWQTGALWIMYVLLTGNGKKFSSSRRYLIAVGALALSGAWFIKDLFNDYYDIVGGRQVHSVSFYFKQHLSDVFPAAGFLDASIPFLSSAYLCIFAFFSVRFLVAFVKSRRMLDSGLFVPDDYITGTLEKLAARIGIRKNVQIWLSDNIHSALTLGFIRPVILLPVAVLNHLSIAQTEAVIAHELFHIRRNDYLVNILLSMAELVLFFNPFARILHAIIRKERENCCDDRVLSLGYSSWEYSESLYLLGASSLVQNRFALAVSGDNKHLLLDRIKRMLRCKKSKTSILKPLCLFLLCIIVSTFGRKKPETVKDQMKSSNPSVYTFSYEKISHDEKPVVIFETTINKQKPVIRKNGKTIHMKLSIAHQPAPPDPPVIPPVLQDKNDPEDEAVTLQSPRISRSFVSGKTEQIEFTIIETKPVVPAVSNAGKLMPYVPASTFYFPDEKDTTAPKEAKKMVNI